MLLNIFDHINNIQNTGKAINNTYLHCQLFQSVLFWIQIIDYITVYLKHVGQIFWKWFAQSASLHFTHLEKVSPRQSFYFFWSTASICSKQVPRCFLSPGGVAGLSILTPKSSAIAFIQTIWKDVTMMQLWLNQGYGQLPSIHKCISWACFGRLFLVRSWQSCGIDMSSIKDARKGSNGQPWRFWFDSVVSHFLINNVSSSFGVVITLADGWFMLPIIFGYT